MSITAIFKELADFVLLLPKLVKINAENRQQIRDAVGIVADELIRGLSLVQSRIEGAKIIARSSSPDAQSLLQTYMAETTSKLANAFSEFKICRGLRETRDQFVRPFDLAKASVRVKSIAEIDRLLTELESDERLIIDDVDPIVTDLSIAAEQSPEVFLQLANIMIQKIRKRKKKVRKLARSVIDAL
jgi:hypothetical protein